MPLIFWCTLFVHIIIFTFPIISITVKSGAGILLAILLIMSVFLCRNTWYILEKWEKKLIAGFILLCCIAALSLINSHDIITGISKLERYLYFLLIIPVYLLLRQLNIETGRTILYGAIVATFVFLGNGIYETTYLGNDHVSGAYHKIVFGDIAILIAIVIVAALITIIKKLWQYTLGIIAIICAFYAGFLSQSRGAWLLVPVIALLLLWIYRQSIAKNTWYFIVACLVGLLTIAIVWQNNPVTRHLLLGLNDIKEHLHDPARMSSWGDRLNLWIDSIAIWQHHPFIGTSIGDFAYDSQRMIEAHTSNLSETYDHAHSIYFDSLATMGIIGLIATCLCVIYWPLQSFLRHWQITGDINLRFYTLTGIIVVVSFAFFGISEGWLSRSVMVKSYLLYLVVFLSSIANHKSKLG